MAKVSQKNRSSFDFTIGPAEAIEQSVFQALAQLKVEVKHDKALRRTGNVCVEFKQWGPNRKDFVKSGIAVSTADYWAIVWEDDIRDGAFLMIRTPVLREMARKSYREHPERVKRTGDNGNWSVVIPLSEVIPYGGIHEVKPPLQSKSSDEWLEPRDFKEQQVFDW